MKQSPIKIEYPEDMVEGPVRISLSRYQPYLRDITLNVGDRIRLPFDDSFDNFFAKEFWAVIRGFTPDKKQMYVQWEDGTKHINSIEDVRRDFTIEEHIPVSSIPEGEPSLRKALISIFSRTMSFATIKEVISVEKFDKRGRPRMEFYGFVEEDRAFFHEDGYVDIDTIDRSINIDSAQARFMKDNIPQKSFRICGFLEDSPEGLKFKKWTVCSVQFELFYKNLIYLSDPVDLEQLRYNAYPLNDLCDTMTQWDDCYTLTRIFNDPDLEKLFAKKDPSITERRTLDLYEGIMQQVYGGGTFS